MAKEIYISSRTSRMDDDMQNQHDELEDSPSIQDILLDALQYSHQIVLKI